jgi:hypothetical protein
MLLPLSVIVGGDTLTDRTALCDAVPHVPLVVTVTV